MWERKRDRDHLHMLSAVSTGLQSNENITFSCSSSLLARAKVTYFYQITATAVLLGSVITVGTQRKTQSRQLFQIMGRKKNDSKCFIISDIYHEHSNPLTKLCRDFVMLQNQKQYAEGPLIKDK